MKYAIGCLIMACVNIPVVIIDHTFYPSYFGMSACLIFALLIFIMEKGGLK